MIDTDRLTLRKPEARDLPAFAAFWTSARTQFMGGPWSADEVVAEWPELTRQWQAHGFSMFVITRKGDDTPIGLAGAFFPEGHPEPELGWNLWDASHEGKGLASEAATAARDWFFANTAHASMVSYINPDNTRSHRLAEGLGAGLDMGAPCPYPPPVRIYRHHSAKVPA